MKNSRFLHNQQNHHDESKFSNKNQLLSLFFFDPISHNFMNLFCDKAVLSAFGKFTFDRKAI